MRSTNHSAAASSIETPVMNSDGNASILSGHAGNSVPNQSAILTEHDPESVTQRSPSAVPKPPPPPYSPEDVRTIEEMFPTIPRHVITDLLDKHHGNKDLVVNHLLQNIA